MRTFSSDTGQRNMYWIYRLYRFTSKRRGPVQFGDEVELRPLARGDFMALEAHDKEFWTGVGMPPAQQRRKNQCWLLSIKRSQEYEEWERKADRNAVGKYMAEKWKQDHKEEMEVEKTKDIVMTALRLLHEGGLEISKRGYSFDSDSDIVAAVAGRSDFQWGADFAPDYALLTKDEKALLELYTDVKKSYTKLEVAIRRFNAAHMGHPEDKLVDLFIALEALYGDRQGEITYKLAMRAAAHLGTDAREREVIFSVLKDGYDIRSRIVHGGKLSALKLGRKKVSIVPGSLVNPLEFRLELIKGYVRSALKKFVKEPSLAADSEKLDNLILSAQSK